MPRIDFDPYPTIAPQSIPLGSEHIPTSPDMFGALIGGAERQFGQGVESVGEAGLTYEKARQELNNEVNDNDTLTWFAKQGTARTEQFKQLEGQSAVNGLDQFQKDLTELRRQTMEGKSPASQAALARTTATLMDRYLSAGAGHAARQEREWHDRSAIDGAKTMGDQAVFDAQNGTWDHVDQSLAASDERIATLWRQRNPSLDPESKAVIDEEVRKNRGGNVRKIVETLSGDGDARTAQAVFDKYKGGMDSASIQAVTSRLRADQARIRGNQVADEETGRLRGLSPGINAVRGDAAAALTRQGITLDVTSGDRTPEHNAAVGGARGSQHLFRDRAIDVSLEGLSREQQQAVVDQFLNDPRVGGFGYYPRSNSIHVDVRPGARTAWGTDYHGTSVGEGWPGWLTQKVQAWQGSTAPRQAPPPGEGHPAFDRADVYNRIVERTADNPLAQSHAIARMTQIFAVERDQRTQGLALFNRRINDTLAEATATGGVRTPLTEDDFVQHRKPGQAEDEARDNYQSYLADLRNGADRHAMEGMNSADLQAMVLAAEPRADSPGGMMRAVQRQAFLQKSMQEIMEQRRKDPAGAVRKSPAVLEAMRQYDPQKPETYQSVANANIAAQEQLGIPSAYQSPIPRDLALQMTAPLMRILPGQEKRDVTGVVQQFEAMFGPDTERALGWALAQHHESAAVMEKVAGVIHNLVIGKPVTLNDARTVDQQREMAAADAAVGRPATPATLPPAEDITTLRRDPGLAQSFDKKYGSGVAAYILRNYPPLPAETAEGKPPATPTAPEASGEGRFVAGFGGGKPPSEEEIAGLERQHAERERQQGSELAMRRLTELDRMEAHIPAGKVEHDRIARLREALLAKYPELAKPYEQSRAKQRDREATAQFQRHMDELTQKESSIRTQKLPEEARAASARIVGQRRGAFDTQLADIQRRREFLVIMERGRLGIRSNAPLSWPADKMFPPADDIATLLHNPALSDKFDAKYGPGASGRILGRTE